MLMAPLYWQLTALSHRRLVASTMRVGWWSHIHWPCVPFNQQYADNQLSYGKSHLTQTLTFLSQYGKLSEIYGRKYMLIVAYSFFGFGCALW